MMDFKMTDYKAALKMCADFVAIPATVVKYNQEVSDKSQQPAYQINASYSAMCPVSANGRIEIADIRVDKAVSRIGDSLDFLGAMHVRYQGKTIFLQSWLMPFGTSPKNAFNRLNSMMRADSLIGRLMANMDRKLNEQVKNATDVEKQYVKYETWRRTLEQTHNGAEK